LVLETTSQENVQALFHIWGGLLRRAILLRPGMLPGVSGLRVSIR
jgi:hypothetical protein